MISRPWLFAIALALQLLWASSMALPKLNALWQGETLFLAIAPYDPYDLLRGRYIALQADIERMTTLQSLPGWTAEIGNRLNPGDPIYVVLEPAYDSPDQLEGTVTPMAWQPVSVSFQHPDELQPHQRILRGHVRAYRQNPDFGVQQYFIPEASGDALEADINQHPDDILLELKADREGNSVAIRLWVQDRPY